MTRGEEAGEAVGGVETHVLDTTRRPAACSCGRARYSGSPTFIRERHAVHVEDVALRNSPGSQATS